MRITFILADDVARELPKESQGSGTPLNSVIDQVSKVGLIAASDQSRKPFCVTPHKMGIPQGLSYDNVEELLEIIEGRMHP